MRPPGRVFLALALALLATACGPAPSGRGASLPFALYLDGAFPLNQLGSFEVVMLTQGSSYDCNQVAQTCVSSSQVHGSIVPLTDASGQSHPGLNVPAALTGDGGVRTQAVAAGGIPVGKDYLVVIEAASLDSPPKLLGSSCNYVQQITAGVNAPLLAAPITAYASGPVACDPVL